MSEENKSLWFKKKRLGWGWRPCSKEGWLVVLFFLTTILTTIFYFYKNKELMKDSTMFLSSIFSQVIILIYICYKKGEKLW